MKLVTFLDDERLESLGALIDDGAMIVDLDAAHEKLKGDFAYEFMDMQTLIEEGPEALDLARKVLAFAIKERPDGCIIPCTSVQLAAPLPRPEQMRDFLAFEQHLKGSFAASLKVQASLSPDPAAMEKALKASGRFEIPDVWYRQPIYYKCNRFSVIGTEADVIWPSYSQLMDYELEFACVIGKTGKDVPAAGARDYIFGYTIFNDFTARDAQAAEMAGMLGPAKGKDFDTGNVLGPCIVTADEILDPYDLTMIARVNGQEWSRGNSGTIHHRFEDMIAFVSRSETLHPGEVLCSGTVGGGCGLEQGRFLQPGDVVELEVSGIGILRNRLVKA